MLTEIIYRTDKRQYFDEILRNHDFNGSIPSGYIIDKTEPAIGATHGEIIDQTRNSIILEPFRTVIEVKKAKFQHKLCAVHEGVTVKNIMDYLKSDVFPKKIMVTPESFPKVIKALSKHEPEFRNSYFLLIDECEKLVSDCLFRNKILQPLQEFKKFTHRSLISATPIREELEMFKEFKRLKVLPVYDHRKDMELLVTNNIRYAARSIIGQKNDNNPLFIFTNCKKTILYLTQLQDVKEDYCVFCAEDLNEKFFKGQNVENVKHSVVEQKYNKYNFFTSRFFSAVDMHLPKGVKAHVLIITNIAESRHSIIDPSIDAVQIYGRCRNNSVATITHLTNLNTSNSFENELSVLNHTNEEIALIQLLKKFKLRSPDQTLHNSIDAIIDTLHSSKVFDENDTVDEFYKHNFTSKRILMFNYSSASLLSKQYQKVHFFKTIMHEFREPFSDKDRITLQRIKGSERIEYIANLINTTIELYMGYHDWEDKALAYNLELIYKMDGLTFECYMAFGYDYLFELGFNRKRMQEELFEHLHGRGERPLLMIDQIIASFPLNVRHDCDKAKVKLQYIYDQFDLHEAPGKKKVAKASDLMKDYFDGKRYNSKKKVDGKCKSYYILHRPKYKLSNKLESLAPDYFY